MARRFQYLLSLLFLFYLPSLGSFLHPHCFPYHLQASVTPIYTLTSPSLSAKCQHKQPPPNSLISPQVSDPTNQSPSSMPSLSTRFILVCSMFQQPAPLSPQLSNQKLWSSYFSPSCNTQLNQSSVSRVSYSYGPLEAAWLNSLHSHLHNHPSGGQSFQSLSLSNCSFLSPHSCQREYSKNMSSHTNPALKIPWGVPINLRGKFKYLNIFYKILHELSCLPLIFHIYNSQIQTYEGICSFLDFCLLFLSLCRCCSLRLKQLLSSP